MQRRTKFKIGDLVIHSGSHYDGNTFNNAEWGIVMECSKSQIDFGKYRSVSVHWFGIREINWVAPRSLFLLEDAIRDIDNDFTTILIDDFLKNINLFNQTGGIGILHKDNDVKKTIETLKGILKDGKKENI